MNGTQVRVETLHDHIDRRMDELLEELQRLRERLNEVGTATAPRENR